MSDAQAVELGRKPRERELEHTQPHPARLEPGRRRATARRQYDDGGDEDRCRAQIWSFSMTGLTETTCRLNLSSDSSSPAATPTSCERCRIGIA